jgi:hypothetical protein
MTATRLRNQILLAVRRDAGLRLAELCEITGAPMAEVRSACWALTNAGALDYCQGYFRPPSAAEDPAQEGMSARRKDLLTAALAYAEAGWPVFPCHIGRKVPVTRHGFENATTDPSQIRAWWGSQPFNIGIPTGAPGPDALDVDARPDGNGWAAFNRVKRAGLLAGAQAMVRTRSGGLHVLFAGTDQVCGRLPRHHLDFKARGGYIIAVPSFVEADDNGPAGRYELLDHRPGTATLNWDAVRRLLEPPPAPSSRPKAVNGDITTLVEWVARREPGDRNHPLYWAAKQAALADALDAEAVERFVDAALRAGLAGGDTEARRTIASAARKAAAR